MKNIALIIFTQFIFIATLQAQVNNACKNSFLIAFYNTENLFDTIDDPHKNDNDFLPASKNNWNSERYQLKINMLASVLKNYNPKKYADVIGLCEIENRQVLKDLVKSDTLKNAAYSIIHYESPDMRGIDVAFLYRPKYLTVLYSRPILVADAENKNFKTRDILYVKGISKTKDTLHFFVNHWPSRVGGQEESDGKRGIASSALKVVIDSLLSINKNAKIVIMGDFNDEPNNESIEKGLNAHPFSKNVKSAELYNLCYNKFLKGDGSYYYWKDKKWNMLDNMIVSSSLIIETNNSKLKLLTEEVEIFRPDWVLRKEKDNTMAPFKTFAGKYQGGYSDHLSVFIILGANCKK